MSKKFRYHVVYQCLPDNIVCTSSGVKRLPKVGDLIKINDGEWKQVVRIGYHLVEGKGQALFVMIEE